VRATPLLEAASKMGTTEVRRVMRRLHVTGSQDKRERKRAVAPYARLMAKAAHAVPLAVCEVLAQHVRLSPPGVTYIIFAGGFAALRL
jgi:THO complex subunit 2